MVKIYFLLLTTLILFSCERDEEDYTIFKYYGSASEDIGFSVAIANDGYLICGQMTEIVKTEVGNEYLKRLAVIKTGFDGNRIWKQTFGDTLTAVGSKIIILEDGSVVCSGYAIDPITEEKDIYIVKMNSDGTNADGKVYKTPGNQTSSDILKTSQGFLVLGTTDTKSLQGTDATGNIEGNTDILLLRLDNSLDLTAAPIAVGYPGNDIGVSLRPDLKGGFIIAGTTDNSASGLSGSNIFVVQTNQDCNSRQSVILGGTDNEYAADLEVVNDGYLISGTVISQASGKESVYVLKISDDNLYEPPLFNITIPSVNSRTVNAMNRFKNNYFVLAGQEGTSTTSEMFFILIDQEGNPVEGKEYVTGGTGVQVANDVVSDSEGNVIAVGKNTYESNSMITLLKFRF